MIKKYKKITGIKTKRSGRRSIADMRQDVLDADGVFLNWIDYIEQNAKNQTKQAIHEFNLIVEKGVFVYETGCILPHPYYSKKGDEGPARVKGYKASFNLFHQNFQSDQNGQTNDDGWPTNKEVSHLCHWNACMNPEHLVLEERWKNWKRLYCKGCDCNVFPKCIAKFHPSAWWKQTENHPKKFGYSQIVKLKEVLSDQIKLLPKSNFRKADAKARNKQSRQKRGSKHALQAKKKKKLLLLKNN